MAIQKQPISPVRMHRPPPVCIWDRGNCLRKIRVHRQLHIARMSAYEGWSQLLLAEAFCTTVFSTVEGETVNYGTEITRAQCHCFRVPLRHKSHFDATDVRQ